MAGIKSFALWVEDQGVVDPQRTVDYIPSAALQSTGNARKDSTAMDPNQTIYGGGGGGPGRSSPIDPEVVQATDSLQKIHGQLRDIFAGIKAKAQAFYYPKMRGAFERELTAGIDGVGRAHAIILPSARGAEHDE